MKKMMFLMVFVALLVTPLVSYTNTSEPVQETVLNLQQATSQEYSCLCTKCGHSWTSKSKPSKCPNCGNRGIVYN